MDLSLFEKAGLTKNETKVYISLLEKGRSTSGPLIKLTGINSSKIYENLNKLQRKGLVSYTIERNKKHFEATEPDRLLDYLEEKRRKIEEESIDIKKILPELQSLRLSFKGEQQEAGIYQGIKGYRTLLENMLQELNPKGTYLVFASGLLKDILGPYWNIYQKKKEKFGIKSRCIWDLKVKKDKNYLKEYYGLGRFISKDSYLSPVDIFVYNDKVIQVSYKTKPIFAVVIKSKGLAQSYRELFKHT